MLYFFKSILLVFVLCLVPNKADTVVFYEEPVEEEVVYEPIYVETPDIILEVPEIVILEVPVEEVPEPEIVVLEVPVEEVPEPEIVVLEVPVEEDPEPEVVVLEVPEDDPEGQTKGADIPLFGGAHGCGINRDCLSCQALEHSGCYWSDDNGCFQLPRGVKKVSQCSGIVEIGEIKATCGNYPTCESCTMQSGCVYYRGECTYSSGPSCRLDVLNCANAPEDCPASFNTYAPKLPYKMEQLLSDPYSSLHHRYEAHRTPHHYPSFLSHPTHHYGHNPFSTISTIPRMSSSHYYPHNLKSRVSYSHITPSSSIEIPTIEIPEIEIRETTPKVRTVSHVSHHPSTTQTITRTSTTPTYSHLPKWTSSTVPSTTVRSTPSTTVRSSPVPRTSTSYGVPYAPGGTVRSSWNQ